MTELKDLVGEHILTGVDMSQLAPGEVGYNNSYDASQCINFVLDGVTYTAIEDPDDGYRSSMADLIVSDHKVTNTFDGVRVVGRIAYDNVIEFTAVENGKKVLSVGTDESDGYYPSFVAYWQPENLPQNEKKNDTPETKKKRVQKRTLQSK